MASTLPSSTRVSRSLSLPSAWPRSLLGLFFSRSSRAFSDGVSSGAALLLIKTAKSNLFQNLLCLTRAATFRNWKISIKAYELLPNNKSSARSASAFSAASACESVLLCGQKWRSQRKQMCLLFIVYIIQQKKEKNKPTLAFFAPQTNAKYFNAKITENRFDCWFLLSFLPFRLPFCPLSVNPSVISFQLGRQFSKNEAHTTEPKGTQRRTSSIRRRSPKEADEEESTTPAMGKWQHWCFGNMCKQLRSIGGRGRAGDADLVDCWSAWHFSLAFFAQCVSVLVIFRQLEWANELRMCEDTFFGCPLEESRTISGSSN